MSAKLLIMSAKLIIMSAKLLSMSATPHVMLKAPCKAQCVHCALHCFILTNVLFTENEVKDHYDLVCLLQSCGCVNCPYKNQSYN